MIIRHLILFIPFLMSFTFVKAQPQNPFSAFDKQSQVQSASVNKRMFQMMANVKTDPTDSENTAYQEFIKNLEHLRTYNSKTKEKANELLAVAESYQKETQMVLLESKTKSGKFFRYFGNKNATKSSVNELLLLIQDEQKTSISVIHLFGSFSLSEFENLSRKLKLSIE